MQTTVYVSTRYNIMIVSFKLYNFFTIAVVILSSFLIRYFLVSVFITITGFSPSSCNLEA